jgi:glycosyltransferase involved in cell wall biosynthesis
MAVQQGPATNHGVRTVGVVVDDFASLAGATDFIVSVVDGLLRAADGRRVIAIFRGTPEVGKRLARNVLQAGMPKVPMVAIPRSQIALASLCRARGIDVVGPLYDPPSPQFSIPWFGYIYDFQHRYLPQYFDAETIAMRDAGFGRLLHAADAVVVHSRSVKDDAERFFPSLKARIFPLSLSAAPRPEWLAADPGPAQTKYGIGSDYFIVSNQFWLHKRQESAIEAFALLAPRYPALRLVLTGSTEDWRVPTRAQDVADVAVRLGIADRVHILGFIPKIDQIAIMRGARAVIQPTAFEGAAGGHSVYDAIALGVPAIVSDIPVNREIADFVSAYFPLDDAAALAARMEHALTARPPEISAETLLEQGNHRRRSFGEEVWRVADYAAARRAESRPPAGENH